MQVYYKPELARAYYKEACFYDKLQVATDAGSLDENLFDKAGKLYKELVPTVSDDKILREEDFDRLVRFWSR